MANTLSSQVLELHEQGYAQSEIYLEMRSRPGCKVSEKYIAGVIQRHTGKSADSRRLADLYDMNVEILAAVRELLSEHKRLKLASRMRSIERQGIKPPA